MKNKVVTFGYVDFEEIEGVYSCIRCCTGLKLLDKKLNVRAKP
jgi:hypothetical protein